MSTWPPDPNQNTNKQPQDHNGLKMTRNLPANASGREWHLLEKTLLAGIEEQRRARRWGIFFKLLAFSVFLLTFFMLSRACSSAADATLTGVNVSEPHIAVVDIEGVISASDLANSHDITGALIEAYETPAAEAVVLNINSPGGSPVQSDEIWQTLIQLRQDYPDKKSYAVIGDIGASGAYYIASAADEIYVNPSSLVGSIGVIMPNYNVEGLLDKLGVKDGTLTAGEYKDILSMSRPLTEFEEQHVEGVLDNTHQHFINAVKKGRGDKLVDPQGNNIFSGLFWTGEQSIKLGLADKSGNLRTIEQELELDNVINYTPIDPLQELFGGFAVKLGHGIGSALELKLASDNQNNTMR